MKKIRENVAGIDIGAKEIFISIQEDTVVSFETFTQDFHLAKEYLRSNNIESIAMEATGVYWIILYEILEAAGFDVWLVDGRQTKQVPGRKTDVKDCQWIRELHSYGLLNRCFIPEKNIKEIRGYNRLREDHIRSASMHINHMQKALTEMNIRLKEVLSQIHGKSGLAIIEAILCGERDPDILLSLCHSSIIKNKATEVKKSLEGFYSEAGLFALKQAFDSYMFYQQKIAECDKKIEDYMEKINGKITKSKKKRKAIRHNKPQVKQLGQHLLTIFDNKDATTISGLTDYTWMQLYSELGNDLTKWPTAKHFTSWLGLAPGQNNSGKKKRNKNKKYRPKAGQIFRQIAQSLLESYKISLGSFGRRLRSKHGPAVAIKATARVLAEHYWRLNVKGVEYAEIGVKKYEEKQKERKEKYILKEIKRMGLQLAETQ